MNVLSNIERDGFAVVPGLLDERSRRDVLDEIQGFLPESSARGGRMRMASNKLVPTRTGKAPVLAAQRRR